MSRMASHVRGTVDAPLVEPKPHRIRFGHHKCLTRYFNAIFEQNVHFGGDAPRFRRFLTNATRPWFASLNNKPVDPDLPILREARMFHVIRHPKDLIVSGYFYHERRAEPWTEVGMGVELAARFRLALGAVLTPAELACIRPSASVAGVLSELDFEQGMMLEMVWRRVVCKLNPLGYYEHPRVLTVRFEDVMVRPEVELVRICERYELDDRATARILEQARTVGETPSAHVRDPSPGQYRNHFTPRLDAFFAALFPRLPERLGYEDHPAR